MMVISIIILKTIIISDVYNVNEDDVNDID